MTPTLIERERLAYITGSPDAALLALAADQEAENEEEDASYHEGYGDGIDAGRTDDSAAEIRKLHLTIHRLEGELASAKGVLGFAHKLIVGEHGKTAKGRKELATAITSRMARSGLGYPQWNDREAA